MRSARKSIREYLIVGLGRLTLLVHSHLRQVVWVRPPWGAEGLAPGVHLVHIGRHRLSDRVVVDCAQPYFWEEGAYAPLENIADPRPLTLVVATAHGEGGAGWG